jgi:glyoxylase-like metal-dependent hydrolase (beta-lactamase superfamily II)
MAGQPTNVRLYALDCGRMTLNDLGVMSDTGDYAGQRGEFAVPCFLISHPKGFLLWNAGLGDALARSKDGYDYAGMHVSVPVTLESQLRALGVGPERLTYLAFSHHHSDHTGNAAQFASATWLINRAELAWSTSAPTPTGVTPRAVTADRAAHTQFIDKDLDVFGDGTVRILATPGHTPGSQSLIVRLDHSGDVILVGDLYASRDSRRFRRVPVENVSRADTLASMDRLERIAKLRHARVVIEHDLKDFKALPAFPGYLD